MTPALAMSTSRRASPVRTLSVASLTEARLAWSQWIHSSLVSMLLSPALDLMSLMVCYVAACFRPVM